MGILGGLYRGKRFASDADDEPGLWTDHWNAPVGWLQGFLDTGIMMTPELAMTVSAVWAAVTFMGRNIGATPFNVFELREPGPGRDMRPKLPIARVIGRQPNRTMTAIEYWEQETGHIMLRGNSYSRILEGRLSFAEQLVPIFPDRVRVERLPTTRVGSPGRIIYRISRLVNPNGTIEPNEILTEEEVFHIRGFMSDGVSGLSLTAMAARSLGTAVAADTFAGRFFKGGATASVVASVQEELDDEAEEDLHESIRRYISGMKNVGGVLVVDQGTTISKLGVNPQEAQLLSTREHSVREVARWTGLPTQVLNDVDSPSKSTAEVFAQELVKYAFRPFSVRLSQAVDRDLLMDDALFAQHDFRAFLRGDMKARAQFHQLAIFAGWQSRQEARMDEDLNPGPKELEEFLQPTNMQMAGGDAGGTGDAGGGRTTQHLLSGQRLAPGERREALRAQVGIRETMFALELAGRVVRHEVGKVTKGARIHADGGWDAFLVAFYEEHAPFVSKTLKIPLATAREYCGRQGTLLQDRGIEVAADWNETLVADLAALALGEEQEKPCTD